jgi:flagellin
VQSSNASNSASDRKALQTEVTQLTSELNRIAGTTEFNGQKLLDGTMGTANFQVGANAGQLISMTGSNFTTNTYGNNTVAVERRWACPRTAKPPPAT